MHSGASKNTHLRFLGIYCAVLMLFPLVSGCTTHFLVSNDLGICRESVQAKEDPPRTVIDMEPDYFCVSVPSAFVPGDEIHPSPAIVNKDVIVYGLKEFVGLSGQEKDFDKIVSAAAEGIKRSGHVLISALTDPPIVIRISYIEKYRHLVFQDMSGPYYKALGAIDLSSVDVSIKPETPAKTAGQASDQEQKLEQAKRLHDKGLIDDEEYKQMKARILAQ